MTTIFVDVPVNQSFVNAVQRLQSVKIYAEKDQDIFKLFPRMIEIVVGTYDMFEVCKKLPFNSAVIVIRDDLFFLPESFLVLEASAKSLNKIYATPFDITGTPFPSSTILFTSGRHWAIGVLPTVKSFSVQNSTLIEDEEIWKQFGDSVWNALEVLSQRRVASPIPSLCAKPKEFPPGINWEKK